MKKFDVIKAAVPLRQAAETYGLRVTAHNMTCCPFHGDKHPSMKLNEDYYFCFGCGASGDVIDFTARLFGLTNLEAAKKLESDFGISQEPIPFAQKIQPWVEESRCRQILMDYLHLLEAQKTQYAPKAPGDSLDDRFVEACKKLDYLNCLLDELAESSKEKGQKILSELKTGGSIAVWENERRESRKEVGMIGREPAIA